MGNNELVNYALYCCMNYLLCDELFIFVVIIIELFIVDLLCVCLIFLVVC